MNNQISFIVIGFGHIGKRHVDLIDSLSSSNLTAVIDTDTSKHLHKPEFEESFFYNSVDAYLNSGKQADVAVIATPNGTHTSIALKCLAAGMHVLIEKPFGLTAADCHTVLSFAEKIQRKVFIVKQNRFSPPVKWLKDLITQGTLGQVYTVEVNCFWNRDNRYYHQSGEKGWRGTKDLDGGVLFTQFSHFVDILIWLFGDVNILHASMQNLSHATTTEFDDTGVVSFQLQNGGLGSFHFTTSVWGENMESAFTIIGEKGSVRIGGQYMDQLVYCNIDGQNAPELEKASPPNQYGGYSGSAGNHFYVLNSVVNAILKGDDSQVISGEEGALVVDVIERMYAAKAINLPN